MRIETFDLSPDGRELLVVSDESGRLQPWLIPLDAKPAAMATATATATATRTAEPRLIELDGVVLRCDWRPDGRRFIAKVDPDGRNDYQLIDVNPADGSTEPIAAGPGTRNDLGWPLCARSRPFSPDGRYLAYATNRRDPTCFDIILRDLASGAERTVLEAGDGVPADRYFPEMFCWDGSTLLVSRLHQQTEQEIYSVDIGTGAVRLLTPHDGPAKHFAVAARPEGSYLCATRDGNFTGLAMIDTQGTTHWIDTPEHDVEFAVMSADGGILAWAVNEDGYTAIRHCAVRDGRPGTIERVTCLPPDAYVFEGGLDGHVLRFGPDGRTLFALNGAGDALWAVDLGKDEATRIGLGITRSRTRRRPETVRFTSADGTTVSAFLYMPDKHDGKLPVVVDVHGGPEIQAMPVPGPLHDKLLDRGIAVLATNIRGSSGYGLRYQRLIYRDWGGGDVADLRAAAEFLRAQPWADQERLAVFGASYGGFAALCCLTMLPEYWAAGVSECGVSDQVEDIRTMPPMWRRRARDWVGDVHDPADLQRLIQASPITHADQVRAPVLLLHGTNDTNVDIASSDAFCARLAELGKPVDYERVDGAGHSISEQVDVYTVICDWLAAKITKGS